MEQTHTEKRPINNWMRIAAAILIPLFTVWYVDREKRINDLKESNNYLRQENKELRSDSRKKDKATEYWIDKYIGCERQIPEIIDTLKARTKRIKNE